MISPSLPTPSAVAEGLTTNSLSDMDLAETFVLGMQASNFCIFPWSDTPIIASPRLTRKRRVAAPCDFRAGCRIRSTFSLKLTSCHRHCFGHTTSSPTRPRSGPAAGITLQPILPRLQFREAPRKRTSHQPSLHLFRSALLSHCLAQVAEGLPFLCPENVCLVQNTWVL